MAHRVRQTSRSPDADRRLRTLALPAPFACGSKILVLPAPAERMPPKFSRPARTDYSATADSTPRGYRAPRGQRPQHTPRGGRSDFSDRRRRDGESNREKRTRLIDDTFNADLD